MDKKSIYNNVRCAHWVAVYISQIATQKWRNGEICFKCDELKEGCTIGRENEKNTIEKGSLEQGGHAEVKAGNVWEGFCRSSERLWQTAHLSHL